MPIVAPDASSQLKPDFMAVVHTIYVEMCNLRANEKVLVITDARVPHHVSAAFHGGATALGAQVVTLETPISKGGPTYQPSAPWPSMLVAAAGEADLIIDLVVGYAPFIADALRRGARIVAPGDGIAGNCIDDMLIRTVRDTDIYAIKKVAAEIATAFTKASTCTLISGDDDQLVIDISDVGGGAYDGFLWDRDKKSFSSKYATLPPAQPGVFLPRGRGNGTLTVDGAVLWHQLYLEQPRTPLKVHFENGKVTNIGGDKYISNRIRNWIEELNDDGAWEGPNHVNIGINPNAVMTQGQEFERVYGAVTCGMGDLSFANDLYVGDSNLRHSKAKVHWDLTIMQPTVLLDDRIILKDGRLFLPSDTAK
jgi:hypothetical protein